MNDLILYVLAHANKIYGNNCNEIYEELSNWIANINNWGKQYQQMKTMNKYGTQISNKLFPSILIQVSLMFNPVRFFFFIPAI